MADWQTDILVDLSHFLDMWLVVMAISTNHMPKIWVSRFYRHLDQSEAYV